MINLDDEILSSDWQRRARLVVGFSGGMDSTVLLHLLSQQAQMRSRIHVVHIDHGVHPDSDKWSRHCRRYCQTLELPFACHKLVSMLPTTSETELRQARLALWQSLIKPEDALVLAHHQDDQLETLLMRLCQGSGTYGLTGMSAITQLQKITIFRPLLKVSKQALENYAVDRKLDWLCDPSNQNIQISRNFLRHQIIAKLKSHFPDLNTAWQHSIDSICRLSKQFGKQALLQRRIKGESAIRFSKEESISQTAFYDLIQVWLKNDYPAYTRPRFKQLVSFFQAISQANIDRLPRVHCLHYDLVFYNHAIYRVMTEGLCDHCHPPVIQSTTPQTMYLPCMSKHYQLPELANQNDDHSDAAIVFWRKNSSHPLISTKQFKTIFQSLRVPPWLREHTPLLYRQGRLLTMTTHAEQALHDHSQDP